jgi:hypothetical protein
MGSIASLRLRPRRSESPAVVRKGLSPRIAVYVAATSLALLTSYLIGKDMGFDTLDYHLYAGFSALHDRFGRDYFAAGPQSYLNPYVYVPFYLLATSRLTGWVAAGILAIAQSTILWLTCEIALQVSPSQSPRASWTLAVCALILAFANPILISQFGSSYADIATAALVLAGWLLLLRAINSPGIAGIACAGFLLGAASALKLTNSVHAAAAVVAALFVPGNGRDRLRYLLVLGCCMAIALVAICAPWSLRLEHHFANPLFPLFNGFFHSPQLPTDSLVDHRFIPATMIEALWRPFRMIAPLRLVDDEVAAADSRYALLLILMIAYAISRPIGRAGRAAVDATAPLRTRARTALVCGFLVDWMLWLAASGNGRYFIPMACIAAILVIALAYRVLVRWPRLRTYAFAGIFCFQAMLLTMGATLGGGVPWSGGRWFDVSVPAAMAGTPALYFLYGDPTNSFIAPFLPEDAGFVNLGGSYVLGPGAHGARIDSLLHRYAPHWRLILRDPRQGRSGKPEFATFAYANAALEAFGLRADPDECARITIRNVAPGVDTGYLLSCQVVPDPADQTIQSVARRRMDVIFDRLEDACPALFRPRRPVTEDYPINRHEQVWARRYADTGLEALVGRGVVQITDRTRGGPAAYVGPQSAWEHAAVPLQCGWRNGRYFERRVSAAPQRSMQ